MKIRASAISTARRKNNDAAVCFKNCAMIRPREDCNPMNQMRVLQLGEIAAELSRCFAAPSATPVNWPLMCPIDEPKLAEADRYEQT